MGGGLMQLVAYGAQDVYLTGNPQITFFKVVYRRHTNFSIEMMELPMDSAKPGTRYSIQVQRNGDLATKMYLKIKVPAITSSYLTYSATSYLNGKVAWVHRLGHAMIHEVRVTIGGTIIDKHIGVWLDIWYELTHTEEQERGYKNMIGDSSDMTDLAAATATATDTVIPAKTLYIPFQFWFCRNYGLALPLIALQYHEVRVEVELEDITRLIVWSGNAAPSMTTFQYTEGAIMVDYIYLDSEERRRFAQVGHEYLIEQVQFSSEETLTGTATSTLNAQKFKLNFNHPCKELIWAMRCGAYNGEANRSTFTGSRGRFLCYADGETDGGWTDALNYAAYNLAMNMIYTGTTVSGTSLTPTIVIPAGSSLTETTNVTCGTSVVGFVVTYVNNTVGALGTQYGYVDADVLMYNTLNMSSELTTVALTITAAGATTYTLSGVSVVAHAMQLRDVSIPVEDFTDTRRYTVAGRNPYDVTVIQPNNYGLRLDGQGNVVYDGTIILNGHDRFDACEGSYFNYVQPWQHHTRTPGDGINIYSFGLHPEQHQPSGTANLSRIDTTQLSLRFSDPYRSGISTVPTLDYVTDSKLYIFAFNYNVLRCMSGMGGLAYSN